MKLQKSDKVSLESHSVVKLNCNTLSSVKLEELSFKEKYKINTELYIKYRKYSLSITDE